MGLPAGIFNINHAKDMAIFRTKLHWVLLVALLVLLFSLPLFLSSRFLSLIIVICVTVISVQGLNILTGYCGQISLGQAAFMAVGAYTSGILSIRFGLPGWAGLICSGLMASLVGLIFGLPAVRIKGFYLAMTTLAAQFIIIWLIYSLPELTGGSIGLRPIPPFTIGNISLDRPENYYFLAMAVTVIMVYLAKNLVRTRIGRAFVAIRDNDLAAEVMGINIFSFKLLAFAICSFYAGIAGSLFAYFIQVCHPEQYVLMDSVWYLGMIIVGGLGSILGGIVGPILLKLLDELITLIAPVLGPYLPTIAVGAAAGFGAQAAAALALIVKALIIGVFIIFEPRGLAHRWQLFKASYRLWPFSYEYA